MNYEQMFYEAVELFNSKDYEEAAEKFEKVAVETNNLAALENAIRAYYICAIADRNMTENGLFSEEYSLDSVTKAISLLEYVTDNKIFTETDFYDMLKDCYAIKGYIMLRCENYDCEAYLRKAINMGNNQSRFWMIYLYTKLVKIVSDDDKIEAYIEEIQSLGELYVENYSPEDTKDDDLRSVSEMLAGFFADTNPEKAEKYAQVAKWYDEVTRTSNPPKEEPKKKRKWFGI